MPCGFLACFPGLGPCLLFSPPLPRRSSPRHLGPGSVGYRSGLGRGSSGLAQRKPPKVWDYWGREGLAQGRVCLV